MLSGLFLQNIAEEKLLEIFIDSLAIKRTAIDEINMPGKKTNV